MTEQILVARESRIKQVESFLNKGYPTVLVLKANIPGINKNISEAQILINIFKHVVRKQMVVYLESEFHSQDGPYVMFGLMEADSHKIKQRCIEIENQHSLGRFVDLDVFQESYQSLSRSIFNQPQRTCYLCSQPVYHCIRTQRHDVETLLNFVKNQVYKYISDNIKTYIIEAMEIELTLEYKFGLVTKTSQGSHLDMNYTLMNSTIDVIVPYFQKMFETGFITDDLLTVFKLSREIGINAEQAMFTHTDGVNCYKGLIFVLGSTIASLGYVFQKNLRFADLYQVIQSLTKSILDDFLVPINTKGFEAYQKHHILGARGEVYYGLPSVQAVISSISDVDSLKDTQIRELLRRLIVLCDDTVLLHRAQTIGKYNTIKLKFDKLDSFDMDQVKQLDQECTAMGLSFGGAADLLVTTLFLKKVESSLF